MRYVPWFLQATKALQLAKKDYLQTNSASCHLADRAVNKGFGHGHARDRFMQYVHVLKLSLYATS
jgi:hypothetical protein